MRGIEAGFLQCRVHLQLLRECSSMSAYASSERAGKKGEGGGAHCLHAIAALARGPAHLSPKNPDFDVTTYNNVWDCSRPTTAP